MHKETKEQWQQLIDSNLPFVFYRKPNENTVWHRQQLSDEIITATPESSGFVMAPFNPDGTSVLIPDGNVQSFDISIEQSTQPAYNLEKVSKDLKTNHIDLVQSGRAAIKNGTFEKVVLSRCEIRPKNKTALEIFIRLLEFYPTAFCYLWHHPKIGTWAGASPELLLQTANGELKTMALAGTKEATNGTSPQWGEKEIEEQAIVTRYLHKRLQPHLQDIRIGAVKNVRSGKLWHLCTHLSGSYNPAGFGAILKTLHPTPAVCGHPKEAAYQFIRTNENYDRAYYTGFLGELHTANTLGKTQSALYVNLRCMQLFEKEAAIYIGGGITAASNPEAEWIETVKKARTMGKVLQ